MAAVLERIHRANRPSFHSLTPKQARIAYLMGAEILDLLDADKAKAWLAKGAQPSDTVVRLFRNAGILPAAK